MCIESEILKGVGYTVRLTHSNLSIVVFPDHTRLLFKIKLKLLLFSRKLENVIVCVSFLVGML